MRVFLSRGMPVVLLAFVALAQIVSSSPDRSSIAGRVMDPSGRPVSNVAMTLAGPAVRQERTATDGRFAFDALPAGRYQLTAHVDEVPFGDYLEAAVPEAHAASAATQPAAFFSDLNSRATPVHMLARPGATDLRTIRLRGR